MSTQTQHTHTTARTDGLCERLHRARGIQIGAEHHVGLPGLIDRVREHVDRAALASIALKQERMRATVQPAGACRNAQHEVRDARRRHARRADDARRERRVEATDEHEHVGHVGSEHELPDEVSGGVGAGVRDGHVLLVGLIEHGVGQLQLRKW